MLVLTIQPGERLVCHNSQTGETVEIEVRKAAGAKRLKLAIKGPKTITYRRLPGIEQQAEQSAE